MKTDLACLAARIDDLEARLAQQDRSSIDLGDEVYRQQREIAELRLTIRHLSDRLSEIDDARTPTSPADEVPPHY